MYLRKVKLVVGGVRQYAQDPPRFLRWVLPASPVAANEGICREKDGAWE